MFYGRGHPGNMEKHFQELKAHGSVYSVTNVVCVDGIVGCALAERWFGSRCDMQTSWQELVNFSQDLPSVVQRGRNIFVNLGHMERNLVSSSRMSFAETLASVFSFTNRTMLEESDVEMQVLAREPLYKWQTLTAARGLILNPHVWYEMLPKLLPSVGYYFTPHSASVVPLVVEGAMDSSGKAPESAVAAIIEFGRVLALQAMALCEDLVFPTQKLVAALVPHKRQILNMKVLRQCKRLREAFVAISEDDKEKMSSPHLYTYLGGGVPHQPPQGYGLVFRGLSHDVADHLCALVSFYTDTPVDYQLIVPKQAMEPKARDAFVNLRMEKIEGIRKRLCEKCSVDGHLWPCNMCRKKQENHCKFCGKTHDVTRDGNIANPACSWFQLAARRADLRYKDLLHEVE